MENLQQQVEQLADEHKLPCLGVVIFDKTAVLDQAITGVRKLGEPTPVTTQDYFHIGSNGKAMTATMIGEVVENGRLSWQATPYDIFTEWADEIHPAYRQATLVQLLSHQAGLPPFEEEEEFVDLPDFGNTTVESRHNFAKYVLSQPPIHPPGSEMRYSNAGFAIATAMLEQATGDAWEQLLHDRILTPLQISGGVGWPALADPSQPWGHIVQDDKIVPHDPNGDYHLGPLLAPAGDVYVRFDEYVRFLQMNLRALDGEQTPFAADMIKYLHTPHGKAGLGWGVQGLLDKEVSAHTGSADTFFALALLNHTDKMGIYMLSNITWEVAEKPCIALLKELLK